MSLYLKQLPIGPMQNFVYLIGDTETRRAVAVDPAWDVDAILNTLRADDMTLDAALITHFHPDHLGGVDHRELGPVLGQFGPDHLRVPHQDHVYAA